MSSFLVNIDVLRKQEKEQIPDHNSRNYLNLQYHQQIPSQSSTRHHLVHRTIGRYYDQQQ